jgi:decaprenyl-phosphate phosphoribosyltransferase
MMVMASVIIVSYIMYTVSPDVVAKMHSDKLYFTVAFVILGLMRYMQITFVEDKNGSPTEIILKDSFLRISVLGWIITFGLLIYM